MRKLLVLSAIALAAAVPAEATAAQNLQQREQFQRKVIKHARDVIRFWRNHPKVYARHWRFASKDARFHRRQLRWTLRELRETLQAQATRLDPAFLCIHRYEGAWNANTGNGYYGGLQMDYGFMQTYGGYLLRKKGTADKWTPAEQIRVAQIARDSGRGYNPWPNTARKCGLL